MTLASCLHRREFRLIELRAIDISPNQMLTRTSGNRGPLCRRTHPLLLDSEIHDGVRFGRDFARNPLNYVNAWVDQRTLFVGLFEMRPNPSDSKVTRRRGRRVEIPEVGLEAEGMIRTRNTDYCRGRMRSVAQH